MICLLWIYSLTSNKFEQINFRAAFIKNRRAECARQYIQFIWIYSSTIIPGKTSLVSGVYGWIQPFLCCMMHWNMMLSFVNFYPMCACERERKRSRRNSHNRVVETKVSSYRAKYHDNDKVLLIVNLAPIITHHTNCDVKCEVSSHYHNPSSDILYFLFVGVIRREYIPRNVAALFEQSRGRLFSCRCKKKNSMKQFYNFFLFVVVVKFHVLNVSMSCGRRRFSFFPGNIAYLVHARRRAVAWARTHV